MAPKQIPPLEQAAQAKKAGDIVREEQIYHDILSQSAGTNESALREQESALIQLGELYRDQRFLRQQCVAHCVDRWVNLSS